MNQKYLSHEEILSKEFLDKYKDKQPDWGFNGLGYIVYKRTYARKLEGQERTEEWNETIARCIKGAQKIGAKYTKEEAERLYDHVFNLRCCFSGRGLWQLGTKLSDTMADALLNCWVKKVSCVDDFVFIFNESMLGGGVGCNISKEYTQEIPRVKTGVKCRLKNTKDAEFIVPDSKEGWGELWRKLLEAYLVTGKGFDYSMVCIRNAGEPLKTFGGIAPGPKPLIDGAEELCRILENRAGKKLRTPDVADIICTGGEIVKSGGIRRTAIILMGDVDDASYLTLKRWDLGGIPNYRANSNNSIICNNFTHLPEKFWDGYVGNGEPYGLINLKLSRKNGRLGETEINGFDLRDDSIIGFNPCAEATLADGESCNLSELFLNKLTSKEQMLDCAKLLYKTQKAIAAHNYLFEETNKIVHKHMRLGLGVTGVCQKLDDIEEWCDYVYKNLRTYDKEWSKQNGMPESIRLSVVKPSGSLSLLPGATPGVHPGFSEYFTRRVRFSTNDPIVDKLRAAGYKIEPEIRFDGTNNHDISVISFPCKFEKGTLVTKDTTAIKQMELVKKLQTCWADQAVSVTTYYKLEELEGVKEWLAKNYNNSVKSISFLLHTNHGFKQPVLEEITKEVYEKQLASLKSISFKTDSSTEIIDIESCETGACPIR